MRVPTAVLGLLLLAIPLSGCLNNLGDLVNPGVGPEDYITDDQYTQWVIEVDYVRGHAPSSGALNLLQQRLSEVVQKNTISIQLGDELPPTGSSWSTTDLINLQRRNQDLETSGNRVVTYMAYVDGGSSQDSDDGRVLGVTIGYDLVVIFDENINNAANFLFSAEEVERTVLVHEFGHALGLVNRGTEMQRNHEDPNYPGHSSNEDSVMYWAVETTDFFDITTYTQGLPTTFDANDKADLCAAGGRC